jgi:hypothetical protein
MRELEPAVTFALASVSEARGRDTVGRARRSRSRSRPPTAEIEDSTFDLLIEATYRLNSRPARISGRSFQLAGTRSIRIDWPPRPDPRKSQLPSLVKDARCRILAACQTQLPDFDRDPPWLPCCLKPDYGTRGEGFRVVRSTRTWRIVRKQSPNSELVVQPLLKGAEYRATVLFDGTYDCSRLVGKTGNVREWLPASPSIPLADLHKILRTLRVPGAGFDLIRRPARWYLLDCNLAPSLKMHGADPANLDRLARAYVRSAVLLAAHRSNSKK